MNGQLIELEKFCSFDPTRPVLAQPFSRGEWTYASNGHVAVRVPLRNDVTENPAAPDASQLFERAAKPRPRYRPAPKLEVSEPFEWEEEFECVPCRGSGKANDCPDCKCKCPNCNGTGKYALPNFSRVSIGRALYAAKYIALLQSLPALELAPPRQNKPLFASMAAKAC